MAAPFRGFLTSHNGSSVNFLGDGTIFWGDGTQECLDAFDLARVGFEYLFKKLQDELDENAAYVNALAELEKTKQSRAKSSN